MKLTVNKSRLFKIAHTIYRKHETSTFSQALKQAWKAMKMNVKMRSGNVEFTFIKVNGEVRHAIGTLNLDKLGFHSTVSERTNYDTMCYFDLTKNAFRSFRISNLI